ncbi:uncharacterized protein BKA55DRAFT_703148 [Fusarium redolens]|uniref:Uncharacterized protein n=1 Tax=Fusarium redolens TaxID=48865 RepID=A0A9P9K4E0_FUSRE|nr:uncharacterized protein BKA55DRAFT_703148 [Fusarium redolens]KAH7247588.1 hypothetical protein BKA55DRAFT_703148 [Fusarium redolens]
MWLQSEGQRWQRITQTGWYHSTCSQQHIKPMSRRRRQSRYWSMWLRLRQRY